MLAERLEVRMDADMMEQLKREAKRRRIPVGCHDPIVSRAGDRTRGRRP
jgi:hypothetical protein